MKGGMTLAQIAREVLGATPGEVALKAVIAALIALWSNLQVISMSVLAFGLLVGIDAVMGAALAKRNNIPFSSKKFVLGPVFKVSMTAAMFLACSIIDAMLPSAPWLSESPVFFGAAIFIAVTQLLDVARKYGTLFNSPLANWLEAKLGPFVKLPGEQ
jgi:uncharacterized membrane protein